MRTKFRHWLFMTTTLTWFVPNDDDFYPTTYSSNQIGSSSFGCHPVQPTIRVPHLIDPKQGCRTSFRFHQTEYSCTVYCLHLSRPYNPRSVLHSFKVSTHCPRRRPRFGEILAFGLRETCSERDPIATRLFFQDRISTSTV